MHIKQFPKSILKILFGKSYKDTYRLKNKSLPKKLPVVSFIIAAKDEAKSIGKCIQSIIDDKYPKTEISIIDDRSTDDTLRIIKKFRKLKHDHISFIVSSSKEQLGPGRAKRKAFEQSSGDICIFFDAHSIIDSKDFVQHYLYYFQDDKVGAVAGARSWTPYLYQDKVLYYAGGLRPWREMGFQFLDAPNSAFRSEVYEQISIDNPKLNWGYDLYHTFMVMELGYIIPVAKEARITIHHDVTPNREIDFIRKPFLYGRAMSMNFYRFFNLVVKRKVDLRIIIGGLLNISALLMTIANPNLWWVPLFTILLTRAHSLAYAIYYHRTPLLYLMGIPIIITISEMAYAIGFLVGNLRRVIS